MKQLHQSLPVALGLVLLALPVAVRAADRPLSELGDAELLQMLEGATVPEGRCATPVAAALQARQIVWSDAALAEGDTLVHDTAGGHFRVLYQLDGTAAVDSTDADESGVPDYVELTGRALERSWSVEIDSLGFPAPDLGGGRYVVSTIFRQGFFGLTYESTAYPGGSYILVHHDMSQFCGPETSPDCPTNALLATVAHEFKHALQIAAGWNLFEVQGWIELDATWMEDMVFDDSNDYYRFLATAGSPFVAPTQSLASTPSYNDATWQHHLSERYGHEFLLRFSERVVARQYGLEPQQIYFETAGLEGVDWMESWGQYTVSTYLTATRAFADLGFEEGAAYPLAPVEAIAEIPSQSGLRTLQDLAMRFHVFDARAGDLTGGVRIGFTGSANGDWTVRAVYQRDGDTRVVEVPLVNGVASRRPPLGLEDYDWFAVVVGNANVPGAALGSGTYSLEFGLEPIPTRPRSMGGFKGRYRGSGGE